MIARFLLLIVAGLLGTWVPCGWSQVVSPSPGRVPGRYQVTVWQDQDGLPQNTVTAITRTRDDYLWLGTVEGLVRFDGVRFTIFDHGNTPEIGNSHVTALSEDHAGALWVGTAGGGLVRFVDGRFTREGPADEYVTCLHEDDAGALWAGTLARGLTCRKDGRSGVPTAAGALRNDHVSALAGDAAGNLWVGTDRGVVRLQGETATLHPVVHEGPGSERVLALCVDGAGTVWAGSAAGLSRFTEGRFVPHALGAGGNLQSEVVRAIREDRAGNLWVGSQAGRVYRGRDGIFVGCPTQSDLPGNNVWALYPDGSGELWVGTDGGGLIRLRDGRFQVLTARDGLNGDFMQTVFQDAAGVVWVGGAGGLSRFGDDGRFSPGAPADGEPVARVKAIGQDRRRGTLWTIMGEPRSGVYALRQRRLEAAADGWIPSVGAYSLLGDRAGNFWVGTEHGLFCLPAEGEPTPYAIRESTGVAGSVVSLFEDRAGDLWVGTITGGVTRFHDGKPTTWTTADGLASNHVLSFYEDRGGAMWIGTHGGGLSRVKDGKFVTVTTRDGLYDNLAFAILEDDFGDLWMSGNKGIYRASLAELNDFADGRTRRVNSFAYGTADGMLSRECNGGSPAGGRMRDGTLWFPTLRGVVVVDPSRRNLEPPRVRIEGVVVDRSPLPPGDPAAEVRLRPGQEDLEIRFTGLSWTRPQQIRFQYQLAGLNRGGWTDAGTGRTALFSRLPAGRYTFQVRADNGDGVWSPQPASLAVVVLPPFWRTWWFLTLAALGVAAAGGGGFWWRGEQLRRRYAVQQGFSRRLIAAHETERRRVAAELHDGLGQTLAMIKNSAVFGVRGAADDPALARSQLEQITQQSAHAIGEMREIAHNLRPYLLDRLGLTKALRSMLNKVADTSGLSFTVAVDDVDGRFAPDAEMSVYRMVQESLNNVLKHADASVVLVRIEAEPTAVHLTVQDDGRGFHAATGATGDGGEGRGFGLLGLAERVRLLGGTHAVVSAPGQGTTVRIHLPGGTTAAGKEAS